MTYPKTVNNFIKHLKQLNYANSTIKNINKGLNSFGRYLNDKGITDILKIDKSNILEYLEQVRISKISEQTKEVKLRIVKQLFDHLMTGRKLFIHPMEGIPLPKKGKHLSRTILTEKEIKRLIETPNTSMPEGIRDRTLIELLYSTGIRLSEITKIEISDIDLQKRTLFIKEGKGKKDRLIPIGKTAVKWLNEYIKKTRVRFINKKNQNPSLFISTNGEKLSPYWVTTTLREYARKSKIKKQVTPQTIRHTMASHLLLGGANIEIIQRILGHENINTTTIYTRVFPVDVKEAHEKTGIGG